MSRKRPGEQVAQRRRAASCAGEPHGRKLSADRDRLEGRPTRITTGGRRCGERRAPGTDLSYPASARAEVVRGRASSTRSPRLGRDPLTAAAWRPRRRSAGSRHRRAADRSEGEGTVRQLGCRLTWLFRHQRRHRHRSSLVSLPVVRHGHRAAAQLRAALAGGLQLAGRAESPGCSRCDRDDDGARHQRRCGN